MNWFAVLSCCYLVLSVVTADETDKNVEQPNEIVAAKWLKPFQGSVPGQQQQVPPSCPSRIYCHSNLLHTVQMAAIFNDSKHFVDMMMLDDEDKILAKFDAFMKANNQKPTNDKLLEFVNANFLASKELDDWMPEDYQEEPPFLNHITNEDYRKFAKSIVAIWPKLGRKMSEDTLKNIDRHSLLPLVNGFIVPGGRFRETYYWDTYWIVQGLLISNMTQTALGMLDNFVTLIQANGFIPNGARVYYLMRSQPPLFALMVYDYIKETNDLEWLQANIQYVAEEVSYWFKNSMVTVTIKERQYHLARYYPKSTGPRPESYKEDFKTASLLPTQAAKEDLYTNLKAGAESGWDFSSRWFFDDQGGNNANLTKINMKRIIPVDLNSFLYKACLSLSIMYLDLGQIEEGTKWLNNANGLREAIRAVLFNEKDGIWYDYDLELKRHRKNFYVSNVAPLWVKAQHKSFDPAKLIKKLNDDHVFDYEGGTPTTLKRSGEQWDLPNAWPPLQAIMAEGLANTGTQEGQDLANKLAKQWIEANMIGFQNTNAMFEKYDANEKGQYGGGGEYDVQSGFGWTNGVILKFIRDCKPTDTVQ